MKKIFLTILALGFISTSLNAQIWLSSIQLNPIAPSSCDNVSATINGTLQCGNSVISLDSLVFKGNKIQVFLNEYTPPICLPIILPFSLPVNLGYLPSGNDTIEALLYKNGIYSENLFSYVTVANSGNNFYQSQNICAGDSAFIAGKWRKSSGNFIDTIQGSGCDTLITTQLTVGGFFNDSNKFNICFGDSVFLANAWQKSAGTFIDTFQIGSGCDSIVLTQLKVGVAKSQTRNVTICQGQGVFAGGRFTDIPGNYIDTFFTYLGCDSIIYTALNVNQKDTVYQNPIICQGQSFFAGGQNRTVTGTYYDYLTNIKNCDSLVVTNLLVNPSYTRNIFDTLCEGDTLFFGGSKILSGGLFDDTLQTINGCDSIQRLLVTLLSDTSTLIDTSVCVKDSLMVNGQYITNTGNYFEFYNANNGCDSSVEFLVTVLPSDSTFKDTTIIDGDSIFVAGAYQIQAGIYFDFYQNSFGCDSILKTTISVETPQVTSNLNFYSNSVEVFPNPSNGKFWVKSKMNISSISIFDISGRLISNSRISRNTTYLELNPKGIFFLEIYLENEQIVHHKIVVE